MKLQDKINKLIPYISGEFLSYPLWEEGYWFPTLHMWVKKSDEAFLVEERFKEEHSSYEFSVNLPYDNSTTLDITLEPRTEYSFDEESGCELLEAVADYSIEEMVDILIEFVEKITAMKTNLQT